MSSVPIQIRREALVSLVGTLTGAYPNPDDAEPHGPGAPIIREVLEHLGARLGPRPEPWVQVLLNPQPLPPRWRFAAALANEAVEKAGMLHEASAALQDGQRAPGRDVAAGFLSRFIDDCGNGRVPPWKHWPGPVPPRGDVFNGADLVVMAAQLDRATHMIRDETLRRDVAAASAKLLDAGLGKL